MRRFAWLVVLLFLVRAAAAGEVIETWDDGTPRLRYVVDEHGVRLGPFTEYGRDGKVLTRGTFRKDRLDGLWTAFHPDGKRREKGVYRAGNKEGKWEAWTEDGRPTQIAQWRLGLRHGRTEVFRDDVRVADQEWADGALILLDGVAAFPKTRTGVETTVAQLLGPPAKKGEAYDLERDRARALRRLQAYRYVCGVPHADLVLDAKANAYAQAASRVCKALGDITHTPTNPGWPQDHFDFAAKGCASCNLGRDDSAESSVDGYFDDSDPTNIDRVGHRCWCLNPLMALTGFGWEASPGDNAFTAMWATDDSRSPAPALDAVAYPARGWMPIDLFGARHAWSVSLSKAQWKVGEPAKVTMEVQPLDADFIPVGAPLALDYAKFADNATGPDWLAIFRPKDLKLVDGALFRVTLGPLGPAAKKKSAPVLRYVVAFFQRTEPAKPG